MHNLLLFPDDPYYCGLRARVPNFVKTNGKLVLPAMTERLTLKEAPVPSKRYSVAHPHHFPPHMPPFAHAPMPPAALWHARSYESGIGAYDRLPRKEKLMYQFYPNREPRLRPLIIQQPR